MSTVTANSVNLTETARPTPAIATLAESEFRVCENCGGPAVVHPRAEMQAIVMRQRAKVLCCACLHVNARFWNQLWRCLECAAERQWGFGRPWDSGLKALLRCRACGHAARHAFARVVGA